MSKGLFLLLALYAVLSFILFEIFHNMLSILVAGIIAALAGIVASRGKA